MRVTPRLVPAVLLAFLFYVHRSSAQDKPLREIAHELQTVHTSEADFPQYDVPEAARLLLFGWKRKIHEVIVNVLLEPKGSSLSPDALKSSIQARLKEEGVDIAHEEPQYYGQLQRIDLQMVEKIPGLLTVVSSLWIGCGEDSSLYVFQRENRGWGLVLSFTAGEYTQIDGALENLKFDFSSLEKTPEWYLVVAYSSPWCTSCWSAVKYKVLRPSTEPDKPHVLYEGKSGLYRCGDELFRLSAQPNDFSIGYVDMMNYDFELFAKVAVDHFAIRGGEIRRIPPIRQNAADLVDQWISLPEEEAVLLVSPGAREQLLQWHRSLSASLKGKGFAVYDTSYEWEQSCAADGTRWQVKLNLSSNANNRQPALPPALYFTVDSNSTGLILYAVGPAENAKCLGKRVRPVGADINNPELP